MRKGLFISKVSFFYGNFCFAGGMIAGPWGYAIGAAGAYFWNPDC